MKVSDSSVIVLVRATFYMFDFECGVIIIGCTLAISFMTHPQSDCFICRYSPIIQQSLETAPSPAVTITTYSERSSSLQCHDPDCRFEEVKRLCNEKTFVVVPAFDTRDVKLAYEAAAGAGDGLHLSPTISMQSYVLVYPNIIKEAWWMGPKAH